MMDTAAPQPTERTDVTISVHATRIEAAEQALAALDPDQGNWPTGEQVEAIIEAALNVPAPALDSDEPDEWFLPDYQTVPGGSAAVRDRIETAQSPTVLHDHNNGDNCGECEWWHYELLPGHTG